MTTALPKNPDLNPHYRILKAWPSTITHDHTKKSIKMIQQQLWCKKITVDCLNYVLTNYGLQNDDLV